MARKTKAEADQTRQQIVDAALDVFCLKGYSRSTFVDISAPRCPFRRRRR